MDWAAVWGAVALLLGGGIVGAAVTWRVHAAQLAFEREKHATDLREERRTRLAGLYKQTAAAMGKAHPRITLQYREPDEASFAQWCRETSEMLWELSLDWRANQVPEVSEAIEDLRTLMSAFTMKDFEPGRYVDGFGNPFVRDLTAMDRQTNTVRQAVEAAFIQRPAS